MTNEIHGIQEGSTVKVTKVSGSKAIDQDSEEWSGNLELGRDEIITWLKEGIELKVTSIKERNRGNRIIVTFKKVDDYRTVVASTYESWPNGASKGLHFDADGYTTHYSDKYFDVRQI